jgi:hypothetical protein
MFHRESVVDFNESVLPVYMSVVAVTPSAIPHIKLSNLIKNHCMQIRLVAKHETTPSHSYRTLSDKKVNWGLDPNSNGQNGHYRIGAQDTMDFTRVSLPRYAPISTDLSFRPRILPKILQFFTDIMGVTDQKSI